jgi:hypothetical protein
MAKVLRVGGVAQVLVHLPSRYKGPEFIPQYCQGKNKKVLCCKIVLCVLPQCTHLHMLERPGPCLLYYITSTHLCGSAFFMQRLECFSLGDKTELYMWFSF